MESIKKTAANVSASAQSGLEKTKATVEEKVEKMSTRDPMQKEMAAQKKEWRIEEAEMKKQEAREHNAASKEMGGYSTFGTGSHSVGVGAGAGAHPIGGRTTHVEGTGHTYGTGGSCQG